MIDVSKNGSDTLPEEIAIERNPALSRNAASALALYYSESISAPRRAHARKGPLNLSAVKLPRGGSSLQVALRASAWPR